MAWANVSNVITDNLDSASKTPAAARADIYNALVELQAVINGRGAVSGVASLDGSGQVPTSQLPSTLTSSTGNVTLTPNSGVVSIENVINLSPTDYAGLPATPASGDVAYLTEDGASVTQNRLVYYTGTAWAYVDNQSTGTFTPNVEWDTGTITVTHNTAEGYYSKSGNRVYVEMNISITTDTTDANTQTSMVDITGMPFTADATAAVFNRIHLREYSSAGSIVNGQPHSIEISGTTGRIKKYADNSIAEPIDVDSFTYADCPAGWMINTGNSETTTMRWTGTYTADTDVCLVATS